MAEYWQYSDLFCKIIRKLIRYGGPINYCCRVYSLDEYTYMPECEVNNYYSGEPEYVTVHYPECWFECIDFAKFDIDKELWIDDITKKEYSEDDILDILLPEYWESEIDSFMVDLEKLEELDIK